jgi:hypothetical protein
LSDTQHPFFYEREKKLKYSAIKVAFALVLSGVTLSSPVSAVENENGTVTLSGFGTLGAVYHNTENVQFRRDISQASGAEAGRISFTPDSMFGMQVNMRPSDTFEVMAQAVSRLNANNDYAPELTWGYLKYKPSENSAIRVGRLGIELYMQGDAAEIGYANLPVRQPVIFYPRTNDGVDAEITSPLADGIVRLKASTGYAVGKLVTQEDPYDTKGSYVWGALAEYARKGWTWRVSRGRITLEDEISGPQTSAMLGVLLNTPNGAAIFDMISMRNRPLDYTSLGLAYDSGPIQVNTSYSTIQSPHWSTMRKLYACGGYRIGKVTPYAGFVVERTDRDFLTAGYPAGLHPALDQVNMIAGLAQASLITNQTDVLFGLRYDLSQSMALKFQADLIRYQDPGSLWDTSLQTAPAESREYQGANIFSITLDFVF